MKGIIKQYRPSFFSGFEIQQNRFETLEQLLNIEWVKKFSKYENFYRYSIDLAEHYETSHTLMAEYKNGNEWWIVGFIDKKTKIKGIETFKPE